MAVNDDPALVSSNDMTQMTNRELYLLTECMEWQSCGHSGCKARREIARLTRERDEYKTWWERDGSSLSKVLNQLSLERACKEDMRASRQRLLSALEQIAWHPKNAYEIAQRALNGEPTSAHETECDLCASGMNSFTDPDTGTRIHARNGTVTPCSAQKAPETKHAQAPIARIEVAGDGTVKKVKDVSLYAPGLPSGVHDLYCEPESSAPMMLEKRAYYETHDPPHCPTCGCGAPETERPIREDIKVGSTLFRAGVKLRIVLERIERGFTYHAEPSEKASETKARLIVDLDAEQGFEAGWRAATAWTDRDDLLSDIGSSAYHAAMTEEFERMLARKPERHALKAPETAASLQAPAVRVVIENGKVAYTTIYDPGLPDGTHDLYCEPEAVAPMMRDETAAKSRNAHISNLTVRLLDAAYVVTWQEDGEPCGSETISEKLAYALVRADGGILGITDDSAVKAPERPAHPLDGYCPGKRYIRSKLFQQFLEQDFWHAHHVDLVWRYNGEDVHEEADWLKDVWYALRESEDREPIAEGDARYYQAQSSEKASGEPTDAEKRAMGVDLDSRDHEAR